MGVFEDDLSFITADVFASAVMFGSQTTSGILDEVPRGEMNDGLVMQQVGTTLLIPANALTGLVIGSTVSVKGVSYLVREFDQSVDGRALTVHLTKVI